ncbi:MAG: MarR family transcriptional regulator [Lachnospiraceae bacterium]
MRPLDEKEEIDRKYAELSLRADVLYHFVTTYSNYIHQARDYGTGQIINMAEVHILTMIADEPGITTNVLARKWKCTKAAVSQNVKKLEQKKLVYRIQDETNKKIFHLYVTDEGGRLALAHKRFDILDIVETKEELLQSCTEEELDTFYKVLEVYQKIF